MEVEEQTSLEQVAFLTQKVQGRLKRIFKVREFDDPANRQVFLGVMPQYESYLEQVRQVQSQSTRSVADHLKACYQEPLMSKDQEYHQFRKYNYHKFLAQKWLELDRIFKACAELKRADEVRKMITNANVRLCIPIVKKYRSARHHEDLVSESYYLIHRAVDYYDYTRNFKFSTYATWAVYNTMGRTAQDLFKHDAVHCGEIDTVSPTLTTGEAEQKEKHDDDHFKVLVSKLLSFAHERERDVLHRRFFVGETLDAIGKDMGVTKERVRQIEIAGIARLAKKAAEMGLSIENVW